MASLQEGTGMMTLDEVIIGIKEQMGLGDPILIDALHYLKAYQWQMTNPDGDHQQLLKCQALLQDFYRSEPLTWDELYSRNGMPVWIEDSFDNGEWYIIECFTASNRFVAHDRWGDTTLFNKKEMDDVWKAYRREHHEN